MPRRARGKRELDGTIAGAHIQNATTMCVVVQDVAPPQALDVSMGEEIGRIRLVALQYSSVCMGILSIQRHRDLFTVEQLMPPPRQERTEHSAGNMIDRDHVIRGKLVSRHYIRSVQPVKDTGGFEQ
jgi:hypothetical protein